MCAALAFSVLMVKSSLEVKSHQKSRFRSLFCTFKALYSLSSENNQKIPPNFFVDLSKTNRNMYNVIARQPLRFTIMFICFMLISLRFARTAALHAIVRFYCPRTVFVLSFPNCYSDTVWLF